VVAAVFLTIIIRISGKKQAIRHEHRKHFFILALLQPFLYFFFESFGLTMVTATTASIIISTIPIFTPIFTYFISREYVDVWILTGLLLSFIGVMLVVRSEEMGTNSVLGIAFMISAVISAIIYGLILKSISGFYSSLTIVHYQNLIGLFYFIPIFFFVEGREFLHVSHSLSALSNIVKLGVMSSTLAFILFTFAIRRIGLINANIFANLIPVFTAVIAYFVLHDSLNTLKLAGIFIVIVGLFVSQFPQIHNNNISKMQLD
jgi:drug/metabolite transporter (DMT)-like permease